MSFFSWLFHKKSKPVQIKVGLALGSGGAKGFAEIGALRAFEENGISFDMVAGTSIGSIIGAFYAQGYSSVDISELMKNIDLSEIKSLFMIKMDTMGMFKVIDRNIGSLNIEDMKKPFRAVATVFETGEEKVFDSGNVAKALCASSSYPPFFKSVNIDGVEYIDGAFSNAVPADVVKNLGADYVVSIDLSNHNPKPSILNKFFPPYQGKVEKPWEKGYEFSDVTLYPDLSAYKPISVGSGSEMYEIGYECAMQVIPKIKADLSALSNPVKKKKHK